MLNIHRGGTFHTDIYEIYARAPYMRTPLPLKTVLIDTDSRLHQVLRLPQCRVNVLHHQSVDAIWTDLRVVAHDRYDIVQSVEQPGPRFVLGVQ